MVRWRYQCEIELEGELIVRLNARVSTGRIKRVTNDPGKKQKLFVADIMIGISNTDLVIVRHH